MAEIHILSSETINRIAAGEVVERPVNVVKELVENSIDAGADAVTVEIRQGGIDLIRVTDNGCGIEPSQLTKAFRRHATSKISDERDLSHLHSLGFRGEALSSIAAVSEVEMITKTKDRMIGMRAKNRSFTPSGAPAQAASDVIPLDITEVGAPDGTTVIVRNLFYNVPVRRKFLRAPQTEAGYITDLMEHLALSHPDISFHYRVNQQEKLHTTGSGNEKELIYRIYGREIAGSVIPVDVQNGPVRLCGFLGRPEYSRSTRAYEIFFVNGRVLKSDILSKGLEEGYRTDLMQHRFPFAILYLTADPQEIDVNVHPSKMEVRFSDARAIYDFINESVHAALHRVELIPSVTLETRKEESDRLRAENKAREEALKKAPHIEQFELPGKNPGSVVREDSSKFVSESFTFTDESGKTAQKQPFRFEQQELFPKPAPQPSEKPLEKSADKKMADRETPGTDAADTASSGQADSQDAPVFTQQNASRYRIIGQVFKTYWLVEFENRLLLIDQHAAHEKVNFERLMKRLSAKQEEAAPSQLLAPPLIITLTGREESALQEYSDYFTKMGYEVEPFGDGSYAIRAIPLELYSNAPDALLLEILDEIADSRLSGTPSAILYKIASMSCKAAVKGNMHLSEEEARALIRELLTLDNPYHCPHGRPTMIIMTKDEVEKKFGRIV